MLNCREITDQSSDYLDDRLPWRVRMEFHLHLLMCRFCREYVRQLRLVVRVLRRLPAEPTPVDVSPELLQHFRAELGHGAERQRE